jgi:hypothetical protein
MIQQFLLEGVPEVGPAEKQLCQRGANRSIVVKSPRRETSPRSGSVEDRRW